MPRPPLFAWEGEEYSFEEKGADWYWALGIIAAAAALAAILFGNALLALLIITAAIAIGITAARHKRTHQFAITESGVVIDDTIYNYEDILSFSVLEYADESLPPSLSLKTKHWFAPHLLIPIVGHDPVEIYEFFIEHIEEGRHDESVIDRVIDLLRI